MIARLKIDCRYVVLFAHFGSGIESVIFQSTTCAALISPPHENAPGSNPVTASDLKQGFGDFFSAAFARCIDLDQLTWLSADVRGLYCPICQLPRRFHLELLLPRTERQTGLVWHPGRLRNRAPSVASCIHATGLQSEIFGNCKIERSRRGRITASRRSEQKNLREWPTQ